MESTDTVALCARMARHGLVEAECQSLAGGRPDLDGVARCESVEKIAQAAFVRTGLRVLASAPSFDDLIDRVSSADFAADRFRIDVHDPSGRLDRSNQHAILALADVMPYYPDLKHPQHRFAVVASAEAISFGEVIAESDAQYRRHDTKPWTTSSSLDSRFARGLVNLVHEATSVLDPCCGAGSIVLEAASLGMAAYGVDWKPALVGMTRENLAHFGYDGHVEHADSRTHVQQVDAVVTDLPYGHAIETDEATVRAILEQCAGLAPRAVFVAHNDITDWIDAAGYSEVVVHTVEKRRGFTRWIHVAVR